MIRKIKLLKRAVTTLEGAGVRLHRAFGYHDVPAFDPFLMLDDFRNDVPEHFLAGFPWHPHRGIETITYMLEGSAEHGDSLGNKGIIRAGEVQWMTAGSGIIHQEMPKPDALGRMYGFQLWTNLPSLNKMMTPRYQDISADMIPCVNLKDGARAKIICGSHLCVKGPAQDIVIDPQYWDVSLESDTLVDIPANAGYTCFIYAYEGEAEVDRTNIGNRTVVLFEDGDKISIKASSRGFKFLFLLGKPLGEPISWRGPIVMNTSEEIRAAFHELEQNTFIKDNSPQGI